MSDDVQPGLVVVVGMVRTRRHPHHTYFGTSLSPSCKQNATIATYAWLNGQLDGWMDQLYSIHFPAALPVHSSVSSAGGIKMPEKFVAMFRVRGWISVSIQSCVGAWRQTMNIRICGGEWPCYI